MNDSNKKMNFAVRRNREEWRTDRETLERWQAEGSILPMDMIHDLDKQQCCYAKNFGFLQPFPVSIKCEKCKTMNKTKEGKGTCSSCGADLHPFYIKQKKFKKIKSWLIWAAIVIVPFFSFIGLRAKIGDHHGQYSREEFENLIMYQPKDKIIQIIGRPDSTGNTCWYYHSITYDTIAQKTDSLTQVCFSSGFVSSIYY